ncbi:MAG: RagB/SusD family nutrient uptake outer membrane protein [Prevotellaceae bacterium]|jgi:hypothetical protein|nr:RagB/SusD family nutrient uptake outer membrane protein [Prevotellaceae bacterium]
MKKLTLILILLSSLILTSCEDRLDTNPTDAVSGNSMMDNTENAIISLNGIYRMMFEWGYSTSGNYGHSFGVQSYTMAANLMGEDLVIAESGDGWFWTDYVYTVKRSYTSSIARSYDIWTYFYRVIANVNYIIAAKETMQGESTEVSYIIGQAYALRAYSYFYLAQYFSRTFKGHENEKCVPIYTEPTSSATKGNARATVNDVYTLIRADIDTAVVRLTNVSTRKRTNETHIDYRVANAFKADICLVTNEWEEAEKAAKIAQTDFSVGEEDDIIVPGGESSSFNDVGHKNVMWGNIIINDQVRDHYRQFMAHMDTEGEYGYYGKNAHKQINKLLYNKLGANDIRRAWWVLDEKYPNKEGYLQVKFKYRDYQNGITDRVYLRMEQMILVEAEALCRQGKDSEARAALMKLMSKRDTSYSVNKTGTALGTLTTNETGSLLEEIIIQRRIELWGEHGRIYDIKRLKQGFIRTETMGHPTEAITALNNLKVDNPETYDWVLTIPQYEFDNNKILSPNEIPSGDQNPFGSGI